MRYYYHIHKQQGSALIVALSILMVLTILGVSAMRTASLEEKLSGNIRDRQIAFEAAEAALRAAETFISTGVNDTSFNGTGGLYAKRGTNAEAWTTADWSTDAFDVTAYTGDVARSPRYIIQLVDSQYGSDVSPIAGIEYEKKYVTYNIYQITTQGFGVSPNSQVMIQGYYARKK